MAAVVLEAAEVVAPVVTEVAVVEARITVLAKALERSSKLEREVVEQWDFARSRSTENFYCSTAPNFFLLFEFSFIL